MKNYDVVVVGAGPSGLMAAKTLCENGHSVALVERKENITAITRACATMLAIENERYFDERMYLNEQTQKIVFPESGFSVDYDGPYRPFYSWNMFSPDGKSVVQLGDYRRLVKENRRLSVTYSKQRLLELLLQDAQNNGCHVYPGSNVVHVAKTGRHIKVSTAEGKCFTATFVIAADGINSRIARITGLNRKRQFFETMLGLGVYFNNLSIDYPDAFNWISLYHAASKLPMAFTVLPCPYPDAEFWMWGSFSSSPPLERQSLMDEALTVLSDSPYSHCFEGAEIVRHNCHVLNLWSPAHTPFLDNIIFVGDSVWTLEAECTGSMMCGKKAANAITTAFRDNRPNEHGVRSYIDWWYKSFPEFEDYKGIVDLFALFELLEEDDVNYLFSLLIDKPLEATLNPYSVSQQINGVLMQKMGTIQQENPRFLAKLQTAATAPLKSIMVGSVRRAFPNA